MPAMAGQVKAKECLMKKKLLMLLLALCMIISMTALTACGGGSGDSGDTASEETATEETAVEEDTDFLLGSWFARTATYNGEEKDPDEIFNGTFHLYFTEDKCDMAIDSKTAPVSWERTDKGVTLIGDDTYYITFPDDSKETLVITINGIDVLMEKYEE